MLEIVVSAAPQASSVSPSSTAPKTAASAPADSGWTLVPAVEFGTRAPGLIGAHVEVSGNLSTQFIVNPHNSFDSTGWMRDARNNELAIVLFDQIADSQVAWMRTNKCNVTCAGVFVRGVVVRARGGSKLVLQMIDVSYESRAGGAAASMVQLDPVHGDNPAVEKQLLPPGGVPAQVGASAATEIPPVTSGSTSVKRTGDPLQDQRLSIRERDLNRAKGMIPGPSRPTNFETSYRSIRDTTLSKVFAKYPWNTGRNEWPRVALVVEEPTGGTVSFGFMQAGDKIKDRCWRLRARLWTGPAASQDIESFNWCLSEMRFDVAYSGVAHWGQTPPTSMTDRNTGPDRTLGPNPPFLPVPKLHYADGLNSDTIMLGNILLDMSFELGVPDGRVWIVDGTKR
jgi:hypothetical protein